MSGIPYSIEMQELLEAALAMDNYNINAMTLKPLDSKAVFSTYIQSDSKDAIVRALDVSREHSYKITKAIDQHHLTEFSDSPDRLSKQKVICNGSSLYESGVIRAVSIIQVYYRKRRILRAHALKLIIQYYRNFIYRRNRILVARIIENAALSIQRQYRAHYYYLSIKSSQIQRWYKRMKLISEINYRIYKKIQIRKIQKFGRHYVYRSRVHRQNNIKKKSIYVQSLLQAFCFQYYRKQALSKIHELFIQAACKIQMSIRCYLSRVSLAKRLLHVVMIRKCFCAIEHLSISLSLPSQLYIDVRPTQVDKSSSNDTRARDDHIQVIIAIIENRLRCGDLTSKISFKLLIHFIKSLNIKLSEDQLNEMVKFSNMVDGVLELKNFILWILKESLSVDVLSLPLARFINSSLYVKSNDSPNQSCILEQLIPAFISIIRLARFHPMKCDYGFHFHGMQTCSYCGGCFILHSKLLSHSTSSPCRRFYEEMMRKWSSCNKVPFNNVYRRNYLLMVASINLDMGMKFNSIIAFESCRFILDYQFESIWYRVLSMSKQSDSFRKLYGQFLSNKRESSQNGDLMIELCVGKVYDILNLDGLLTGSDFLVKSSLVSKLISAYAASLSTSSISCCDVKCFDHHEYNDMLPIADIYNPGSIGIGATRELLGVYITQLWNSSHSFDSFIEIFSDFACLMQCFCILYYKFLAEYELKNRLYLERYETCEPLDREHQKLVAPVSVLKYYGIVTSSSYNKKRKHFLCTVLYYTNMKLLTHLEYRDRSLCHHINGSEVLHDFKCWQALQVEGFNASTNQPASSTLFEENILQCGLHQLVNHLSCLNPAVPLSASFEELILLLHCPESNIPVQIECREFKILKAYVTMLFSCVDINELVLSHGKSSIYAMLQKVSDIIGEHQVIASSKWLLPADVFHHLISDKLDPFGYNCSCLVHSKIGSTPMNGSHVVKILLESKNVLECYLQYRYFSLLVDPVIMTPVSSKGSMPTKQDVLIEQRTNKSIQPCDVLLVLRSVEDMLIQFKNTNDQLALLVLETHGNRSKYEGIIRPISAFVHEPIMILEYNSKRASNMSDQSTERAGLTLLFSLFCFVHGNPEKSLTIDLMVGMLKVILSEIGASAHFQENLSTKCRGAYISLSHVLDSALYATKVSGCSVFDLFSYSQLSKFKFKKLFKSFPSSISGSKISINEQYLPALIMISCQSATSYRCAEFIETNEGKVFIERNILWLSSQAKHLESASIDDISLYRFIYKLFASNYGIISTELPYILSYFIRTCKFECSDYSNIWNMVLTSYWCKLLFLAENEFISLMQSSLTLPRNSNMNSCILKSKLGRVAKLVSISRARSNVLCRVLGINIKISEIKTQCSIIAFKHIFNHTHPSSSGYLHSTLLTGDILLLRALLKQGFSHVIIARCVNKSNRLTAHRYLKISRLSKRLNSLGFSSNWWIYCHTEAAAVLRKLLCLDTNRDSSNDAYRLGDKGFAFGILDLHVYQ